MLPFTRIPFNRVGTLPAPAGHDAPELFLLPLHYNSTAEQRGSLVVLDEKDPARELPYSFGPLKPNYWSDWSAIGWEDCEIGRCTLQATAPNGERFSWNVLFAHDGDPSREFWGAVIEAPSKA